MPSPVGQRTPSAEEKGTLREDTIILCSKCGAKNSRTDIQCRRCDADLAEVKRRLVESMRKH